jgi:putative hydrolase of the HAD superfamily
MGTLLELESPAPPLRAVLAERFGVHVSEPEAAAAIREEIGYYRAHLDQGRDAVSLASLRARCAEVVRQALPRSRRLSAVGPAEMTEALLAALRFRPFADAEPALRAARARGLAVVVVSNWDASLPEVLERVRLAPWLDGVMTSAVCGHRKPAPEIFHAALALVGGRPADATHVGDSPVEDVAGARAAGIEPVLIARDGAPAPNVPARVVTSLLDLI